MQELPVLETPHERRVTWSLIALVFAFVLLMTCIVLWITSALIRNQSSPADPASAPALVTSIPLTDTSTATPMATPTITITPAEPTGTPSGPILVDSTWTPVPGKGKYVRFLYWYVRPNTIKVGECLQLTWETENAASLNLYRNDELLLEDVPPAKTLQDCPSQLGYAVYRLEAENSAGQRNWIQLQVKVEPAP